jgi:hypothetical protein
MMRVVVMSADLWQSPYSPLQQQLFKLIRDFHDRDGWNFQQISDWLNANGFVSPRGRVFNHTLAWSMYRKKNQSIRRFARKYQHTITNLHVESAEYFPSTQSVAV